MRTTRKSDPEQVLAEQERAFRQQLPHLLRAHEGEYVAVRGGLVVGHSPDDEDLARRMFAQFGDEPFYIAKVQRQPSVCDLPSPEAEP